MRCRTCDYVLFNLREPVCPECGTGFDIRSYKFRKETVAFACPHCEALHGGEGDRYLPATSDSAQCQACGREMTVAAMRVVPLVPLDQVEAILETLVPWEERKRIGRLSAWWKTITMSMFRPGELGRRIDATTSEHQAYWFAMWVIAPAVIVPAGVLILLYVISFLFGLSGSFSNFMDVMAFLGAVVVFGAATIVLSPAYILLFGAYPAHLMLRVLGKATQPVKTTAAMYLYATGPMWFLVLPLYCLFCCGYFLYAIFPIWSSISAAIALANLHKTSGWVAVVAVYWFQALLLGAFIAYIIAANDW